MKALLVATDSQTQQAFRDALRRSEHEVTVVEDGDAACAMAGSGDYALIVLAMEGPGEEKIDLCRRLRAALPDGRAVILAADGDHETKSPGALLSAGADDLLPDLQDTQQLDLRLVVAEHRLAAAKADRLRGAARPDLPIHDVPLLNHAPYGVFRTSFDGKVLEVNQTLVAMMGYESEEETLKLDIARDVYRDSAARSRLLAQPTDDWEGVELDWKRKDGTPITVRFSGRAVRDDDGKRVRLEGIVEDITEQKQAAEKLRRSEEWHRSLIELGCITYAVLDPQGKIVYQSPLFERLYGWTPEDVVGRSVFEHVHPDDTETAMREFAEVVARPGSSKTVETRYRHKDGSWRMIEASAVNLLENPVVGGIVVTSHDITEQKQTEETLHHTNEELRAIHAASPDGMLIVDVETRQFHGANPAMCEMLGYSEEQLRTMSIPSVHPPEDLAHVLEVFETQKNKPRPTAENLPLLRKDGSVFYADITGSHLVYQGRPCLMCGFRDITERKEAERAVRESEVRFRSLIENMPDIVMIVDAKGTVEYVNYTLADPPPEQRVGTSSFLSVAPEYEEACRRTLQRVIETGEAQTVEAVDDLGLLWVCRAVPLSEGGRTGQVMVICTNVTEQRNAEEALRQSERRHRLIADNVTDIIHTVEFEKPIDPSQITSAAEAEAAFQDQNNPIRSTYVSPSVQHILGYRPDEVMEMTPQQMLTRASYAAAERAFAREFARSLSTPGVPEAPQVLELECVKKDGTLLPCEMTSAFLHDDAGRIAAIVTVTRDISKRKEAERAFRESEAKFGHLFENLPDFVIVLDRQARIEYVNHSAPNTTAEQLIGSTGFDFIAPESQPACREAFGKVMSTRQTQFVEMVDLFGRWWACRLVPMTEGDHVRNVMIICTDITESRAHEEAVSKEQRLLRQLLDLHERDRQLIAYEIHDGFAQQLTGAQFNLEAFQRLPERDSAEAQSLLDAGVRLLSDSIDETRRLISGLRPPVLDEFGIVAAVEYLVCENREHQGIPIEFHHDVRFDRLAPPLESTIFRMVQESLTNACQHSQSDRLCIDVTQRDDRIAVEVRDWGVGFDPDAIEEHRFGLRGIRERARLFGGEATVESAPGKGTRVLVDLPVIEAARRPPDP